MGREGTHRRPVHQGPTEEDSSRAGGRALAKKHTGGRCFGYDSVEEPNPTDRERPRSELRVNEEEAKLVRRIFQMYADGTALGSIVETLNREGIPATYDGKGYSMATGAGWAKNQVSLMLRNERYLGKVIWNKREFYRDPITKKRRARGSEAVERRLKAEEAKLVEARAKLTAVARSGRPKEPPAIQVDALVADLRSLRTLSEKDPAAARQALLQVVESVTLKPAGDEYEATLAFRNTTAAIAGGRCVGDKVVAGACTRGLRAPRSGRCSSARSVHASRLRR